MRALWIAVLASLLGCTKGEPSDDVVLPDVPPDTVVLSWSFISRSEDRKSTHALLEATRDLTRTTRSASGTMMSVESKLSEKDYRAVVDELRRLDCCSLVSTGQERSHPAEAEPLLELDLGDMRCEVKLWDREWRLGRARECGVAATRALRVDFVPDLAVDDPPR